MPILVDLTEQELEELKAFTHETDAAAAVRSAMAECLRLARRIQLKTMSGQLHMEDNWRTLEAAELRAQNGNSEAGAG